MRLLPGAIALLFCILIHTAPCQAQVILEGPDSVTVATQTINETGPDEDRRFFLSTWNRPAKAALFSAVVPGMGQVYNRAYWKVPIIYATGAVLGYFIVSHNDNYQELRTALLIRRDGDPTTVDRYSTHPILGEGRQGGTENLRYNRDFFRRNRDLTILLSALAYGLNIAEAYVHAHLKEFDVSEDLSMRLEPNLMQIPGTATATPGLTITLITKAK